VLLAGRHGHDVAQAVDLHRRDAIGGAIVAKLALIVPAYGPDAAAWLHDERVILTRR
jgi:hypothetical protein